MSNNNNNKKLGGATPPQSPPPFHKQSTSPSNYSNSRGQLPDPEDLFDFDDNMDEIPAYMPHSNSALKLQIVGREADLFHQEDWNDDFDDSTAITIAQSLQTSRNNNNKSQQQQSTDIGNKNTSQQSQLPPSPAPSTNSISSTANVPRQQLPSQLKPTTQPALAITQTHIKPQTPKKLAPPQQQPHRQQQPQQRPDSADSIDWGDSDDDFKAPKQVTQPQAQNKPTSNAIIVKKMSVSRKSHPLTSGDDSPWDDDDDDDVVVIPKKTAPVAAPVTTTAASSAMLNQSSATATNPVIAPHVKAQLKNPELRGEESDWSLDSDGDWDAQLDDDDDDTPKSPIANRADNDPTKGARSLGKYVDTEDDDDDYEGEAKATNSRPAGGLGGQSHVNFNGKDSHHAGGHGGAHHHGHSGGSGTAGSNSSGFFSLYNKSKPVRYLKSEHRLVSALDSSSLQSGVDIIMYPAPPTLFTMLTLDGFRGITDMQVISFLSQFGLRLNNLAHPLSLALMNNQPSSPHSPLKTVQYQALLDNQSPWLLPDSTVTRCLPLITYLYYCHQYAFLSYKAKQYQQTWDIFSTVMAYLGITVERKDKRTMAIINSPIAFRIIYQLAFLASKLWTHGMTSEPYRWYIAFLACIIFPHYAPLWYLLEINTIAHHTGMYSNQVLNVLCQIYEAQNQIVSTIPPVPINHMGLPTHQHSISHNLTQFTNLDSHIAFYTSAGNTNGGIVPPPTPAFNRLASFGMASTPSHAGSSTPGNAPMSRSAFTAALNSKAAGNGFTLPPSKLAPTPSNQSHTHSLNSLPASLDSVSTTSSNSSSAQPPAFIRPSSAVVSTLPPVGLLGENESVNPKAIALEACLHAITSIELYLTGYSPLNGTPLNDLNDFDREHDHYKWIQSTGAMSLEEYRRNHLDQQPHLNSNGPATVINNNNTNANSWYIMNSPNAWNLLGHSDVRIAKLYQLYLQHHEWTWVKSHAALCLARHHLHIGNDTDHTQQAGASSTTGANSQSHSSSTSASTSSSSTSATSPSSGGIGSGVTPATPAALKGTSQLGGELHNLIAEKLVMETLYILDNIPLTPSYDYLFELCNNQQAVYTQKTAGLSQQSYSTGTMNTTVQPSSLDHRGSVMMSTPRGLSRQVQPKLLESPSSMDDLDDLDEACIGSLVSGKESALLPPPEVNETFGHISSMLSYEELLDLLYIPVVSHPSHSQVALLSLEFFSHVTYNLGKYKFSILALESAHVLYELRFRESIVILRRLSELCLAQNDTPRALYYHYRILQLALQEGNVSSYVYVVQELTKLYQSVGSFRHAEDQLRMSIAFLLTIASPASQALSHEVLLQRDRLALGNGANSSLFNNNPTDMDFAMEDLKARQLVVDDRGKMLLLDPIFVTNSSSGQSAQLDDENEDRKLNAFIHDHDLIEQRVASNQVDVLDSTLTLGEQDLLFKDYTANVFPITQNTLTQRTKVLLPFDEDDGDEPSTLLASESALSIVQGILDARAEKEDSEGSVRDNSIPPPSSVAGNADQLTQDERDSLVVGFNTMLRSGVSGSTPEKINNTSPGSSPKLAPANSSNTNNEAQDRITSLPQLTIPPHLNLQTTNNTPSITPTAGRSAGGSVALTTNTNASSVNNQTSGRALSQEFTPSHARANGGMKQILIAREAHLDSVSNGGSPITMSAQTHRVSLIRHEKQLSPQLLEGGVARLLSIPIADIKSYIAELLLDMIRLYIAGGKYVTAMALLEPLRAGCSSVLQQQQQKELGAYNNSQAAFFNTQYQDYLLGDNDEDDSNNTQNNLQTPNGQVNPNAPGGTGNQVNPTTTNSHPFLTNQQYNLLHTSFATGLYLCSTTLPSISFYPSNVNQMYTQYNTLTNNTGNGGNNGDNKAGTPSSNAGGQYAGLVSLTHVKELVTKVVPPWVILFNIGQEVKAKMPLIDLLLIQVYTKLNLLTKSERLLRLVESSVLRQLRNTSRFTESHNDEQALALGAPQVNLGASSPTNSHQHNTASTGGDTYQSTTPQDFGLSPQQLRMFNDHGSVNFGGSTTNNSRKFVTRFTRGAKPPIFSKQSQNPTQSHFTMGPANRPTIDKGKLSDQTSTTLPHSTGTASGKNASTNSGSEPNHQLAVDFDPNLRQTPQDVEVLLQHALNWSTFGQGTQDAIYTTRTLTELVTTPDFIETRVHQAHLSGDYELALKWIEVALSHCHASYAHIFARFHYLSGCVLLDLFLEQMNRGPHFATKHSYISPFFLGNPVPLMQQPRNDRPIMTKKGLFGRTRGVSHSTNLFSGIIAPSTAPRPASPGGVHGIPHASSNGGTSPPAHSHRRASLISDKIGISGIHGGANMGTGASQHHLNNTNNLQACLKFGLFQPITQRSAYYSTALPQSVLTPGLLTLQTPNYFAIQRAPIPRRQTVNRDSAPNQLPLIVAPHSHFNGNSTSGSSSHTPATHQQPLNSGTQLNTPHNDSTTPYHQMDQHSLGFRYHPTNFGFVNSGYCPIQKPLSTQPTFQIIGSGDNSLVLPDPRVCAKAFSSAYSYFEKLGDRINAAKSLRKLVQVYLEPVFTTVVVLKHPVVALAPWFKSSGFAQPGHVTANTYFDSQLSNSIPPQQAQVVQLMFKKYLSSLEFSATTSMNTAAQHYLPLVMIHSLLNLSELRYLQYVYCQEQEHLGLPVDLPLANNEQPLSQAYFYWYEAKQSFFSSFVVNNQVLLPTKHNNLDYQRQFYDILRRLTRLLVTFDKAIVINHLDVIDTFTLFDIATHADCVTEKTLEKIDTVRMGLEDGSLQQYHSNIMPNQPVSTHLINSMHQQYSPHQLQLINQLQTSTNQYGNLFDNNPAANKKDKINTTDTSNKSIASQTVFAYSAQQLSIMGLAGAGSLSPMTMQMLYNEIYSPSPKIERQESVVAAYRQTSIAKGLAVETASQSGLGSDPYQNAFNSQRPSGGRPGYGTLSRVRNNSSSADGAVVPSGPTPSQPATQRFPFGPHDSPYYTMSSSGGSQKPPTHGRCGTNLIFDLDDSLGSLDNQNNALMGAGNNSQHDKALQFKLEYEYYNISHSHLTFADLIQHGLNITNSVTMTSGGLLTTQSHQQLLTRQATFIAQYNAMMSLVASSSSVLSLPHAFPQCSLPYLTPKQFYSIQQQSSKVINGASNMSQSNQILSTTPILSNWAFTVNAIPGVNQGGVSVGKKQVDQFLQYSPQLPTSFIPLKITRSPSSQLLQSSSSLLRQHGLGGSSPSDLQSSSGGSGVKAGISATPTPKERTSALRELKANLGGNAGISAPITQFPNVTSNPNLESSPSSLPFTNLHLNQRDCFITTTLQSQGSFLEFNSQQQSAQNPALLQATAGGLFVKPFAKGFIPTSIGLSISQQQELRAGIRDQLRSNNEENNRQSVGPGNVQSATSASQEAGNRRLEQALSAMDFQNTNVLESLVLVTNRSFGPAIFNDFGESREKEIIAEAMAPPVVNSTSGVTPPSSTTISPLQPPMTPSNSKKGFGANGTDDSDNEGGALISSPSGIGTGLTMTGLTSNGPPRRQIQPRQTARQRAENTTTHSIGSSVTSSHAATLVTLAAQRNTKAVQPYNGWLPPVPTDTYTSGNRRSEKKGLSAPVYHWCELNGDSMVQNRAKRIASKMLLFLLESERISERLNSQQQQKQQQQQQQQQQQHNTANAQASNQQKGKPLGKSGNTMTVDMFRDQNKRTLATIIAAMDKLRHLATKNVPNETTPGLGIGTCICIINGHNRCVSTCFNKNNDLFWMSIWSRNNTSHSSCPLCCLSFDDSDASFSRRGLDGEMRVAENTKTVTLFSSVKLNNPAVKARETLPIQVPLSVLSKDIVHLKPFNETVSRPIVPNHLTTTAGLVQNVSQGQVALGMGDGNPFQQPCLGCFAHALKQGAAHNTHHNPGNNRVTINPTMISSYNIILAAQQQRNLADPFNTGVTTPLRQFDPTRTTSVVDSVSSSSQSTQVVGQSSGAVAPTPAGTSTGTSVQSKDEDDWDLEPAFNTGSSRSKYTRSHQNRAAAQQIFNPNMKQPGSPLSAPNQRGSFYGSPNPNQQLTYTPTHLKPLGISLPFDMYAPAPTTATATVATVDSSNGVLVSTSTTAYGPLGAVTTTTLFPSLLSDSVNGPSVVDIHNIDQKSAQELSTAPTHNQTITLTQPRTAEERATIPSIKCWKQAYNHDVVQHTAGSSLSHTASNGSQSTNPLLASLWDHSYGHHLQQQQAHQLLSVVNSLSPSESNNVSGNSGAVNNASLSNNGPMIKDLLSSVTNFTTAYGYQLDQVITPPQKVLTKQSYLHSSIEGEYLNPMYDPSTTTETKALTASQTIESIETSTKPIGSGTPGSKTLPTNLTPAQRRLASLHQPQSGSLGPKDDPMTPISLTLNSGDLNSLPPLEDLSLPPPLPQGTPINLDYLISGATATTIPRLYWNAIHRKKAFPNSLLYTFSLGPLQIIYHPFSGYKDVTAFTGCPELIIDTVTAPSTVQPPPRYIQQRFTKMYTPQQTVINIANYNDFFNSNHWLGLSPLLWQLPKDLVTIVNNTNAINSITAQQQTLSQQQLSLNNINNNGSTPLSGPSSPNGAADSFHHHRNVNNDILSNPPPFASNMYVPTPDVRNTSLSLYNNLTPKQLFQQQQLLLYSTFGNIDIHPYYQQQLQFQQYQFLLLQHQQQILQQQQHFFSSRQQYSQQQQSMGHPTNPHAALAAQQQARFGLSSQLPIPFLKIPEIVTNLKVASIFDEVASSLPNRGAITYVPAQVRTVPVLAHYPNQIKAYEETIDGNTNPNQALNHKAGHNSSVSTPHPFPTTSSLHTNNQNANNNATSKDSNNPTFAPLGGRTSSLVSPQSTPPTHPTASNNYRFRADPKSPAYLAQLCTEQFDLLKSGHRTGAIFSPQDEFLRANSLSQNTAGDSSNKETLPNHLRAMSVFDIPDMVTTIHITQHHDYINDYDYDHEYNPDQPSSTQANVPSQHLSHHQSQQQQQQNVHQQQQQTGKNDFSRFEDDDEYDIDMSSLNTTNTHTKSRKNQQKSNGNSGRDGNNNTNANKTAGGATSGNVVGTGAGDSTRKRFHHPQLTHINQLNHANKPRQGLVCMECSVHPCICSLPACGPLYIVVSVQSCVTIDQTPLQSSPFIPDHKLSTQHSSTYGPIHGSFLPNVYPTSVYGDHCNHYSPPNNSATGHPPNAIPRPHNNPMLYPNEIAANASRLLKRNTTQYSSWNEDLDEHNLLYFPKMTNGSYPRFQLNGPDDLIPASSFFDSAPQSSSLLQSHQNNNPNNTAILYGNEISHTGQPQQGYLSNHTQIKTRQKSNTQTSQHSAPVDSNQTKGNNHSSDNQQQRLVIPFSNPITNPFINTTMTNALYLTPMPQGGTILRHELNNEDDNVDNIDFHDEKQQTPPQTLTIPKQDTSPLQKATKLGLLDQKLSTFKNNEYLNQVATTDAGMPPEDPMLPPGFTQDMLGDLSNDLRPRTNIPPLPPTATAAQQQQHQDNQKNQQLLLQRYQQVQEEQLLSQQQEELAKRKLKLQREKMSLIQQNNALRTPLENIPSIIDQEALQFQWKSNSIRAFKRFHYYIQSQRRELNPSLLNTIPHYQTLQPLAPISLARAEIIQVNLPKLHQLAYRFYISTSVQFGAACPPTPSDSGNQTWIDTTSSTDGVSTLKLPICSLDSNLADSPHQPTTNPNWNSVAYRVRFPAPTPNLNITCPYVSNHLFLSAVSPFAPSTPLSCSCMACGCSGQRIQPLAFNNNNNNNNNAGPSMLVLAAASTMVNTSSGGLSTTTGTINDFTSLHAIWERIQHHQELLEHHQSAATTAAATAAVVAAAQSMHNSTVDEGDFQNPRQNRFSLSASAPRTPSNSTSRPGHQPLLPNPHNQIQYIIQEPNAMPLQSPQPPIDYSKRPTSSSLGRGKAKHLRGSLNNHHNNNNNNNNIQLGQGQLEPAASVHSNQNSNQKTQNTAPNGDGVSSHNTNQQQQSSFYLQGQSTLQQHHTPSAQPQIISPYFTPYASLFLSPLYDITDYKPSLQQIDAVTASSGLVNNLFLSSPIYTSGSLTHSSSMLDPSSPVPVFNAPHTNTTSLSQQNVSTLNFIVTTTQNFTLQAQAPVTITSTVPPLLVASNSLNSSTASSLSSLQSPPSSVQSVLPSSLFFKSNLGRLGDSSEASGGANNKFTQRPTSANDYGLGSSKTLANLQKAAVSSTTSSNNTSATQPLHMGDSKQSTHNNSSQQHQHQPGCAVSSQQHLQCTCAHSSFPPIRIPALGMTYQTQLPNYKRISLYDSESLLPPPIDTLQLNRFVNILDSSAIYILLAALLCETRVLIVSSSPNNISSVIDVMLALMFPFKWQSLRIPLLHRSSGAILHQKRPYLIGCLTQTLESITKTHISSQVNTIYQQVHNFPTATQGYQNDEFNASGDRVPAPWFNHPNNQQYMLNNGGFDPSPYWYQLHQIHLQSSLQSDPTQPQRTLGNTQYGAPQNSSVTSLVSTLNLGSDVVVADLDHSIIKYTVGTFVPLPDTLKQELAPLFRVARAHAGRIAQQQQQQRTIDLLHTTHDNSTVPYSSQDSFAPGGLGAGLNPINENDEYSENDPLAAKRQAVSNRPSFEQTNTVYTNGVYETLTFSGYPSPGDPNRPNAFLTTRIRNAFLDVMVRLLYKYMLHWDNSFTMQHQAAHGLHGSKYAKQPYAGYNQILHTESSGYNTNMGIAGAGGLGLGHLNLAQNMETLSQPALLHNPIDDRNNIHTLPLAPTVNTLQQYIGANGKFVLVPTPTQLQPQHGLHQPLFANPINTMSTPQQTLQQFQQMYPQYFGSHNKAGGSIRNNIMQAYGQGGRKVNHPRLSITPQGSGHNTNLDFAFTPHYNHHTRASSMVPTLSYSAINAANVAITNQITAMYRESIVKTNDYLEANAVPGQDVSQMGPHQNPNLLNNNPYMFSSDPEIPLSITSATNLYQPLTTLSNPYSPLLPQPLVSIHSDLGWYNNIDYNLPALVQSTDQQFRPLLTAITYTTHFRHFLTTRHRLKGIPVSSYLFDQWCAIRLHNEWINNLFVYRQQQFLAYSVNVARVNGNFHRRLLALHGPRLFIYNEDKWFYSSRFAMPKHDRLLIPGFVRVTFPLPEASSALTPIQHMQSTALSYPPLSQSMPYSNVAEPHANPQMTTSAFSSSNPDTNNPAGSLPYIITKNNQNVQSNPSANSAVQYTIRLVAFMEDPSLSAMKYHDWYQKRVQVASTGVLPVKPILQSTNDQYAPSSYFFNIVTPFAPVITSNAMNTVINPAMSTNQLLGANGALPQLPQSMVHYHPHFPKQTNGLPIIELDGNRSTSSHYIIGSTQQQQHHFMLVSRTHVASFVALLHYKYRELQLQLQAIAFEDANAPVHHPTILSSPVKGGNKELSSLVSHNSSNAAAFGSVAQQLFRMNRTIVQPQCLQPVLPLLDAASDDLNKFTGTNTTTPLTTLPRDNGDVIVIPSPQFPPVLHANLPLPLAGQAFATDATPTHGDDITAPDQQQQQQQQQQHYQHGYEHQQYQGQTIPGEYDPHLHPPSQISNHTPSPAVEEVSNADIRTKPAFNVIQQQVGLLTVNKVVPVVKDDYLPSNVSKLGKQNDPALIPPITTLPPYNEQQVNATQPTGQQQCDGQPILSTGDQNDAAVVRNALQNTTQPTQQPYGPQNLPSTTWLEYTQAGQGDKVITFDPSSTTLGQLLTYRGAYNFAYIKELEEKRQEINRETNKYVTKYLTKHHLLCGILAGGPPNAIWWNPNYAELFADKKGFRLFNEAIVDLAQKSVSSDPDNAHIKDKKVLQVLHDRESKMIRDAMYDMFSNIDPSMVQFAKQFVEPTNKSPKDTNTNKSEPPNPLPLQHVYTLTRSQLFHLPIIPPMPLSKKQTVYIQHFNQIAQHVKQLQLPLHLDLLKDVTNPENPNSWERGFEIKVDTYQEFVALNNSLQSRLLTPEMLSRWREFG